MFKSFFTPKFYRTRTITRDWALTKTIELLCLMGNNEYTLAELVEITKLSKQVLYNYLELAVAKGLAERTKACDKLYKPMKYKAIPNV